MTVNMMFPFIPLKNFKTQSPSAKHAVPIDALTIGGQAGSGFASRRNVVRYWLNINNNNWLRE